MRTSILLLACLFLSFHSFAVTIADIQGGVSSSPYAGMVVSTAGIVTAIHGSGYFIQDGTGPWNGIYVFSTANSPSIGDSISITGEVDEFYDLTELKNISSYTLNSIGNPLPVPEVLPTGDISDEAYEGVLVEVQGATCTDPSPGFGEFILDDGTGSCRVDDLMFLYTATQGVDYNVTGPLYYSFGDYKIVPRDANDVSVALALFMTRSPEEFNITTSGFTINWQTNANSNTIVEYGLTPALELGVMNDPLMDVEHEIVFSGLTASTVYYLLPYSVSGTDTTPSRIMAVSTASNSSGEVNVYFNHSVDHSEATISEAVWTLDIIDTIISYIDMAQTTLDVTIYEVEDSSIIFAINAAFDRGVQVRYITDDDGNNLLLDTILDPAIPVLRGNDNGIMHNKFILIDAGNVNGSWVMTGSMNHTHNNLGFDYNNIICIQDQSLVQAYELEFEEMWGSTGAMPDTNAALFSEDKTDNTPHKFNVGGIPMELYFSPSDGATKQIQNIIDSAKNSIEFALLIFTENSLGDAIVDADDRGLTVRGIIDLVESNGSEYNYLLSQGIDVMDYVNADSSMWPEGPQLHHKYMIADYPTVSETPVLVTGSHNWTASAESRHDENTLIIYDEEIVNWYHQEFNARYLGFNDSIPVDTMPDTMTVIREIRDIAIPLNIYPNPAENFVNLDLPTSGELVIYSEIGQVIYRRKAMRAGNLTIPTDRMASGKYTVILKTKEKIYAGGLIKR